MRNSDSQKNYVHVAKITDAIKLPKTKKIDSSRGENERVLEQNGDKPWEKYLHAPDEKQLHQQLEVSHQTSTVLQHTKKMIKDFLECTKTTGETDTHTQLGTL